MAAIRASAFALLLTLLATPALAGRALRQIVVEPRDPSMADEFRADLTGMSLRVHMDECDTRDFTSPKCSLLVDASAPAVLVPKGKISTVWVRLAGYLGV
jgi:hypothetical protein